MRLTRLLVLTMGPPVLIGAVYALTFPAAKGNRALGSARLVALPSHLARHNAARHNAARRDETARACTTAAEDLLPHLPANSIVIVRPPFILAGDLSEDELDRLYREAVLPVTMALWRSFFDRRPDQPVTIVALASESAYHAAAARLDGYEPLAYAGYTQRDQRRLVLNLATGRGTLAHELSHVLAAFDFPEMPEWFDEGLAALHEDATFSPDGLTMIGTSNWRSMILHDALREARVPSLESTILSDSFRGEGEGLNYAVVRCFCQYLQERRLLSHFYRKFRGRVNEDPTGMTTLCELLGTAAFDEIDRDFRVWLGRQGARAP